MILIPRENNKIEISSLQNQFKRILNSPVVFLMFSSVVCSRPTVDLSHLCHYPKIIPFSFLSPVVFSESSVSSKELVTEKREDKNGRDSTASGSQ